MCHRTCARSVTHLSHTHDLDDLDLSFAQSRVVVERVQYHGTICVTPELHIKHIAYIVKYAPQELSRACGWRTTLVQATEGQDALAGERSIRPVAIWTASQPQRCPRPNAANGCASAVGTFERLVHDRRAAGYPERGPSSRRAHEAARRCRVWQIHCASRVRLQTRHVLNAAQENTTRRPRRTATYERIC